MGSPDLEAKMREYARQHQLKFNIKGQLGEGTDGAVWATSKNSVIKVIQREKTFEIERSCYMRLQERRISEVDGLAVPRIIEFSRELKIIEMTLVHPPFLLDFGKAYIDEPSPYTPEQLKEWRQQWRQFFPKQDIPRVHKVLGILRGYGIEYVDPKPWNIRFHAKEPPADEMPDDSDDSYEPYEYE